MRYDVLYDGIEYPGPPSDAFQQRTKGAFAPRIVYDRGRWWHVEQVNAQTTEQAYAAAEMLVKVHFPSESVLAIRRYDGWGEKKGRRVWRRLPDSKVGRWLRWLRNGGTYQET